MKSPFENVDHPEITCVEWFFGAGGNHLGLRRVIPDLRTIAACEIESYACANLVAKAEEGRLDPFPVWTDCKTFPCELFVDRVALFVASYPCPGESNAGKGLGKEDPRWLWPYCRRFIAIARPRGCFFENVEGHIGRGLRSVLTDLVALGYRVEGPGGEATWGVFSAAEVGASHRRKRVFIYAELADGNGPWEPQSFWKHGEKREWPGNCRIVLANSLRCGDGRGQQNGDGSRSRHQADDHRQGLADTGVAGLPDAEPGKLPGAKRAVERGTTCEFRLPPFPPGPEDFDAWDAVLSIAPELAPALPCAPAHLEGKLAAVVAAESQICGVADGMAHRVDRLRLCGNGVVPETAARAFITLYGRMHGK